MRLTAFFKLYKICILLHRCNLKIFAKKSVWKISIFCENSAKFLQMLKNLQNFTKFQKFQLDNLVDFEKSWKTRTYSIHLQRSVPIQAKPSKMLPKFWQKSVGGAASLQPVARRRSHRLPEAISFQPMLAPTFLRSVKRTIGHGRESERTLILFVEKRN